MAKQKTSFWEENKVNIIGWVVVIVLIAAIFVGGSFATQQAEEQQTDILGMNESDHVKGDENAEIKVIEYADFQCPGCASFASLVSQLIEDEEIEQTLSVTFRHFPLTNIHPFAVRASVAAEAAAQQDKFWEMHDLLFASQSSWSSAEDLEEATEMFIELAEVIDGIDVEQFRADLESEALVERVQLDNNEARAMNLPGTPSIFVNGELLDIDTVASYEDFRALVLEAAGV